MHRNLPLPPIDTQLFLPDDRWGDDWKKLLKDPKSLAVLGAGGLVLAPFAPLVFPLGLLGFPLLNGSLGWLLIAHFAKGQRKKKIQAILSVFGSQYDEAQLDWMADKDSREFNRLFKLASDDFFRKYVQEQAGHRKAQQLIRDLQSRIDSMRERMQSLERKASKHQGEILQLKQDIEVYEQVFESWQKAAA